MGIAFWTSITLVMVGMVLAYVFGWLGEAQDDVISHLKRLENY